MHRPLIKKSRTLRKQQTRHEIKLWRFVRNGQCNGFKFRRQHPIGPYIVDFFCPQKKLIIELDGGGHAQTEQSQKDRIRDQYFHKNGYKLIRIWNSDVDQNWEGVRLAIEGALVDDAASPLTLTLSPQGGEGTGLHPGSFSITCPIPLNDYPHVLLAHGGGGRLMNQLIQKMFLTAFGNPILDAQHDAALLRLSKNEIAFTTDSYVVRPLFFSGGDIGSLAVHGTVNDLAMAGARPLYMSVGFILEEGFPMETLWKVVLSMREAAQQAGVQIVTGDTKVVNKGKGDGVFINTSGVGILEHSFRIAPQEVQEGDAILVSGDLGRHGVAIMAAREGLSFETTIQSDSVPLADLVLNLLSAGILLHCMRDLTRGGLASALVEIAELCEKSFLIEERAVPVAEEVQGACEILGLDPLYVANEGRFVLFVSPSEVEKTLHLLRNHPLGRNAEKIGEVSGKTASPVLLKSRIGVQRILDRLSGEQLPRIC